MNYYKLDHEATIKDIEKFNYPNQRVGVISIISNDKGQILLQQRGKSSRDANFLYENIGGSVEDYDSNFKEAILREIKEEAGEDIKIETSDSIGIYLYKSEKEDINWIFVIYSFKYLGGEIKIIEKEKCMGYEFIDPKEALKKEEVSAGCRELLRNVFE